MLSVGSYPSSLRWFGSSESFSMDVFFAFFRVTARYIMKKKALDASHCGDPISDFKSLPVTFSSFTDMCTSSNSRWIRWSSLFSRFPFVDVISAAGGFS